MTARVTLIGHHMSCGQNRGITPSPVDDQIRGYDLYCLVPLTETPLKVRPFITLRVKNCKIGLWYFNRKKYNTLHSHLLRETCSHPFSSGACRHPACNFPALRRDLRRLQERAKGDKDDMERTACGASTPSCHITLSYDIVKERPPLPNTTTTCPQTNAHPHPPPRPATNHRLFPDSTPN